MAELVGQPPVANRRTPLEMIVDRVWRFFCSVRAAIYEVSILAVMVLIGTLRGSEVPQLIADLIPGTQGFVDRWYDFDVYKSLPFAFMLGLLAVAITVCTMNRAPGLWQSIAHPTITTTHGFLRGAEVQLHTERAISREALSSEIESNLKFSRYRVLTAQQNGETHIYADRYRFGKLGTFPFHLALIMILIGGIVGSRYGFRETAFVINEGATQAVGHGTGLSVHLVDFEDSYTEAGQAAEYRSDLVLMKDGEPVKEESITVNHPMTYRSTVFYQTSFGPSVVLQIADANGTLIYDGAIPVGVDLFATGNPEAPAGLLDLIPAGKRVYVITPDSNPPSQPELDKLKLRSGEISVIVQDLNQSDQSAQTTGVLSLGQPAAVDTLTFTFVRESQWTLLQIASNPAIPIFWAAAFLVIGGLGVVFYFPHRRIRAIVSATSSGGSRAAMAPMARRDWSARRSFEQIASRINERTGGEWQFVERKDVLQSSDGLSTGSTT